MTGEPKQLHKTLVKQHVGQALVFAYDNGAHKGTTVLIKAIANKANCKPATGKSYKVSPHTCNMLHDKPADDN